MAGRLVAIGALIMLGLIWLIFGPYVVTVVLIVLAFLALGYLFFKLAYRRGEEKE